VAPLSEQVGQASSLDLKLDLLKDVMLDRSGDRDTLAKLQILEMWNDQGMLKVNLDRRLGFCTEDVKERMKQILRWSYGVEPYQEGQPWVGRPIEGKDDPRLRFQEQELEATRFLREPVEQLYRLLEEGENKEIEEESSLDTREMEEYIEFFEAWQEEIFRDNQMRDERLSQHLRENFLPAEFEVLKGSCPDTSTLVDYQEGNLPFEHMEEIRRHVVFCRSCLEGIVALGQVDEVEYDPERDYSAQVELPQELKQEFFGHLSEAVIKGFIAGQFNEQTTTAHFQHLAFCQRCLEQVWQLQHEILRIVLLMVFIALKRSPAVKGAGLTDEIEAEAEAEGRKVALRIEVLPEIENGAFHFGLSVPEGYEDWQVEVEGVLEGREERLFVGKVKGSGVAFREKVERLEAEGEIPLENLKIRMIREEGSIGSTETS